MYSKEKVLEESLVYFGGDDLAASIWVQKYALKNKESELLELNPDQMHHRLSREFARIESKYKNPISKEEIYRLFKDFKYVIPQGSPMSGIGNKLQITSLSNCFVIGNEEDSYGAIMKTDEEQVQLMKRRGGVGHDLSHLRPSGSVANNSVLDGLAGATLYMHRYSNSTREVSQGGRRGALMLSISVNHPDAGKFIDSKLDTSKITGANISIKITDRFMESVERGTCFYQTFPIDLHQNEDDYFSFVEFDKIGKIKEDKLYNGVDSFGNKIYFKKVDARKLWGKIVKNAWKSAEPGILFWDQVLRESPANSYGGKWTEKSTNPCGELPLNPYDSCRLLAINLYSYVDNPFTNNATFNFVKFKEDVRVSQRLIDDLNDLEIEKLLQIKEKLNSDKESKSVKRTEEELWDKIISNIQEGRRTGLGVTAEGDMLAALGLIYGSKEATEFAVKVHEVLAVYSYMSSIELAKERGHFPSWDYEQEKDNPFINRILSSEHFDVKYLDLYKKFGRRNIANLTIAPTGSVSILTKTTSGIELLFSYAHTRRVKTNDPKFSVFTDEVGDMWKEFNVIHKGFQDWYDLNWYKLSISDYDLNFKEPLEDMSQKQLQKVFEFSPYFNATSNDVNFIEKVKMQGQIQKWVDHSISVTINVPKQTTIQTINDLYLEAFKSGCKGVTVYRNGSRSGVLVDSKKEEEELKYREEVKRPKILQADIFYHTIGRNGTTEKWMIIVGLLKGKPYEIFAIREWDNFEFPKQISNGIITKVKSGVYQLEGNHKDKRYILSNIADNMVKDDQVDTRKYSRMLRNEIDPKDIAKDIAKYALITSFEKAIKKALLRYVNDESQELCPNCSQDKLRYTDGCLLCPSCGYSKC